MPHIDFGYNPIRYGPLHDYPYYVSARPMRSCQLCFASADADLCVTCAMWRMVWWGIDNPDAITDRTSLLSFLTQATSGKPNSSDPRAPNGSEGA